MVFEEDKIKFELCHTVYGKVKKVHEGGEYGEYYLVDILNSNGRKTGQEKYVFKRDVEEVIPSGIIQLRKKKTSKSKSKRK